MTRLASLVIGAGVILCSLATQAQAQESTSPPPPPVATHSSASSGSHGKLGVGVVSYLTPQAGGVSGLSLVYEPGPWHIDTLIGFNDNPNTIRLGGRFWFHVHSTGSADLSVGAGVGYVHQSMNGASADFLSIQAGGLIRVWLASNVALGLAGGLAVGAAYADGYNIGAVDFISSAGVHYYF